MCAESEKAAGVILRPPRRYVVDSHRKEEGPVYGMGGGLYSGRRTTSVARIAPPPRHLAAKRETILGGGRPVTVYIYNN